MKKFLVFLFLFLACTYDVQAKIYIVCVGINSYPNAIGDLKLCVNDALTMKEIYEKNRNSEILLITEGDATQSNIQVKMRKLFANAKKSDTIVMFFSGHGTSVGLLCYNGIMTYQSIYNIMAESEATTRIVFADVCFAGKARRTAKKTKKKYAQNVMYFLSSRSDETSRESLWGNNGRFTFYLSQGLKGGADSNKDRVVTAKELYNFVSRKVTNASNGTQHPVMWGNFDSDMALLKW